MPRKVWPCVVTALIGVLVSRASGQTLTFDASMSNVHLEANTLADDLDPPGPVIDMQLDNTLQTPFVDLMGGLFDLGENVSSSAADGPVSSNAGSFVKGNQGATLSIEWRAATDLEVLEDQSYLGTANASLSSTLAAQLGGLIPGVFYRVVFDWSYGVIAIEDHEAGGEDPESAHTSLDFTFGMNAVSAFSAVAPPSGFDANSGSSQFILLATAAPIDLTIDIDAFADATMASPPIPGSPPEDGAGSEAFGSLRIRVVPLIPEPATAGPFAFAVLVLALGTRRRPLP